VLRSMAPGQGTTGIVVLVSRLARRVCWRNGSISVPTSWGGIGGGRRLGGLPVSW